MKKNVIQIEVPEGKKAEWVDGVLTLVAEKDKRPVTERIKTFDDAYEALGPDHPLVVEYDALADVNKTSDLLAYLKLRIITAALNEGWEPQFTEDEWRYWPYFYLYTKEQYDRLSDDEKKDTLLIVGGYANRFARCVVSAARSHHGFSTSNSSVGSRLAFKSSELAVYAGKQFIDIFAPFVVAERLGD